MDIQTILKNLHLNLKRMIKHILGNIDNIYGLTGSDNSHYNYGECCCSKKRIKSRNIYYCINENYSCYFGCDCIEKSNIHTKKAIDKKMKEEVNKEKERLKQIEYEEQQKIKFLELEVQRKQREVQRKQREEQERLIFIEINKQMREKVEQERSRQIKLQRNKEIEIIKLKLENNLSKFIKKRMDKEYNEKCKIIFNKINSQSQLLKYYNSQVDEEDIKYYLEKRYLYNWYDYKETIKSYGGKWDNDNKKWYFINKKNYNDFHKSNNISI
jgi:hypothetical protein